MEHLAVGGILAEHLRMAPLDGYTLASDENGTGLTVWAYYRNIAQNEVDAFRNHNFDLALFDDGLTGFLLLKTYLSGWNEMPFHFGVPDLDKPFKPLQKPETREERYRITLVAVDPVTWVIHALRMFSISPGMSRGLYELSERQRMLRLTKERWFQSVAQTQYVLPSKLMAKQAKYKCRSGD